MKWSEFEALQRIKRTLTNEEEMEVFGSTEDTTAYWHKLTELAIKQAAAEGTLGRLSWSEWTALCQAQRPKVDGAK